MSRFMTTGCSSAHRCYPRCTHCTASLPLLVEADLRVWRLGWVKNFARPSCSEQAVTNSHPDSRNQAAQIPRLLRRNKYAYGKVPRGKVVFVPAAAAAAAPARFLRWGSRQRRWEREEEN